MLFSCLKEMHAEPGSLSPPEKAVTAHEHLLCWKDNMCLFKFIANNLDLNQYNLINRYLSAQQSTLISAIGICSL